MAEPTPAESPEQTPSFFADLLAAARDPYRFPAVALPVIDDEGVEHQQQVELVVEVPDDEQVARLDECADELDELDLLAGDDLEDLLDVLDLLGRDPAEAADDLLEHFGLLDQPEIGWHALVERINLYGRGLEFDLWERRHSLGEYFRGHPDGWDHLIRVGARLPPGSHYKAAIQDDDELARQIGEEYGPPSKRRKKGPQRPALEGWTQEVSLLHQILNASRFAGWAALAAQAGKKRGKPPAPSKGPETADDRYEWADYMREHTDVVSRVLVRKGGSKKKPPPEATGRTGSPPGSFTERPSGLWAPGISPGGKSAGVPPTDQ